MDRSLKEKTDELRSECGRLLYCAEGLENNDIKTLEQKADALQNDGWDYISSLPRYPRNSAISTDGDLDAIKLGNVYFMLKNTRTQDGIASEREREAAALYTEYAVDSALFAVRRAYISVLAAAIAERESK
ncbi:MAG: hypothetical protein IKS17_05570 [Firmicutes bacterium]|nr:hypothetical protein [Bacillota bacterium]